MSPKATVFTRTLGVAAVGLMVAAMAAAAEAPVAVSPGDASKLALVDGRCPAFSWAGGEGAKSYELVVYRVGEQGEEAEPVLRQNLPAPAYSWTPSLDRCLERGGQYAWSVRAVGKMEASEWSALSLFEVASGPSEAEFEEALEVVNWYLGAAATDAEVKAGEAIGTQTADPGASQTVGSSSALTLPAGDSDLQVNGAAVVTTATFGAAVGALNLACPGALGSANRYTDCGNGTVRDNNTGLFWLKDASCADLAGTNAVGRADWPTAETAAAALASGTCGLTDGSSAGDWRQPTISELCSAWAGSNLVPCPASAALDSLVDSTAGPPTIAAGHPFVEVQSIGYWSATESDANSAWGVNLGNGNVVSGGKVSDNYVWPVRVGQ